MLKNVKFIGVEIQKAGAMILIAFSIAAILYNLIFPIFGFTLLSIIIYFTSTVIIGQCMPYKFFEIMYYEFNKIKEA